LVQAGYVLLYNLLAGLSFGLLNDLSANNLNGTLFFSGIFTFMGVPFLVLHFPPLVSLYLVRATLIRRGRIALLANPRYVVGASVLLSLLSVPLQWAWANYLYGGWDPTCQPADKFWIGCGVSLGVMWLLAFASVPTAVAAACALPLWLGDPRD
jgi:hypothetical protein